MELNRLEGDQYIFEMGKREKRVLLEILNRYPLIPVTHLRVTRSSGSAGLETNQRLLEEALTEQRAESKKQLDAWLQSEDRFKAVKAGFLLTLSRHQAEWLLQVLNDVRVGSWIKLGEPNEMSERSITLTSENAPDLFTMEASAYFESVLLEALDSGNSPGKTGT